MSYLRFVYKTWNIFWLTVLALATLCVLLVGVGFFVLQLDSTKDYLAGEVEEAFGGQFEGVLTINSLQGSPPFFFNAIGVKLYPDSSSTEPVASIDSMRIGIDPYELLQRKLVVTNIELFQPYLALDSEGEKPWLGTALTPKKKTQVVEVESNTEITKEVFKVELLAPATKIINGTVDLGKIVFDDSLLNLPEHWSVDEIDAELYAEYNDQVRFLDIEKLGFSIPGLLASRIELFGQIFNDSEYLEFNAFSIKAGRSELQFGTKARGVNITTENIASQLKQSFYEVDINNLTLDPTQLKQVYPSLDMPDNILFGSFQASGGLDSLDIDQVSISTESNILAANGYLVNILDKDEVGFRLNLEQAHFEGEELAWLASKLNDEQRDAISQLQFSGYLAGNTSYYEADVVASGLRGILEVSGHYDMQEDTSYNVQVKSDSINIGGLFEGIEGQTLINGHLDVVGKGLTTHSAVGDVKFSLTSSSINGYQIDTLDLSAPYNAGVITPELLAKINASTINSEGTLDLSQPQNSIRLKGSVQDLDVQDLIAYDGAKQTYTSVNYELNATGNSLDEAYGQLTIDIPESVINGDTLPLHQLYLDLNAPTAPERELRLTSTPLDFNLKGDINLGSIRELYAHWETYFKERFASEISFEEFVAAREDSLFIFPLNLNFDAQVKDIGILQTYVSDIPDVQTSASILGNITVDSKNLLFNANISDALNRFDDVQADSIVAQVTGNFRYNSEIKDFSGIELTATVGELRYKDIITEDVQLTANLSNDSLFIRQQIGKVGENATMDMTIQSIFRDSSIVAYMENFSLGNGVYQWENDGVAEVIYDNHEKLFFNEFKLRNEEQFVELDGVISKELQDSMLYNIQNLNLQDASDLINGRVSFSGQVNGEFSTRALTRTPTIQGDLNIEELAIQGRIVGDIDIKSELNQELNRFDTRISILTDSLKYPDYFIRNSRSGQDIVIDGYVYAPTVDGFGDQDTLYYFDLDFKEIDMWFLPFVAPNVFEEMEGTVSGNGLFYGNLDDYDYKVDYTIEDVIYLKPVFLETFYYLTGDLSFSPEKGLEFIDMFVTDPTGGYGLVNGYYDFNDFTNRNDMNIRVEMTEMQFLKSSFDSSEPFFGNAFGTGTVLIRGTNFNPIIETVGAVQITEGSEVGIPLLEETVVDKDRKFIRMVDSFDPPAESDSVEVVARNEEENPIKNQTFNERFTLDLQFEATNPFAVRLIFDNVTGEVISTNGLGRLRITLEDQELSMFGQYDIQSGDYNFVSGDIFARRFLLDPGGSISWEGPPDNANLSLSAVYRSRPDVRALSCVENFDITDPNAAQRRQVELVLDVGGTISAIQNDFSFRLPNSLDNIQDNTLRSQLSSLNSTQDEKLLQATSLLLTGRFVSICNTDQSNSAIAQGINSSSVVLNPLLSNQVISPLLSNQVNALLNSDVSSLDIDFNINEFNEVDLGVALRLYNDRLVFRRDGQVTGQQSNLGDIGATYRINQTISVTAFHRRDPSFGNNQNSTTQQVQDINGVGIEAQVEFDKGNELFEKIGRFFSRLFGKKKTSKAKKEQVTELRENNDQ